MQAHLWVLMAPRQCPKITVLECGSVFYRQHDDGIEVVRVPHGARDLDSISDDGGFGVASWHSSGHWPGRVLCPTYYDPPCGSKS